MNITTEDSDICTNADEVHAIKETWADFGRASEMFRFYADDPNLFDAFNLIEDRIRNLG